MKKGKNETLYIGGVQVEICYAAKDNPRVINTIKELLERQRISPKKALKFDGCGEK